MLTCMCAIGALLLGVATAYKIIQSRESILSSREVYNLEKVYWEKVYSQQTIVQCNLSSIFHDYEKGIVFW